MSLDASISYDSNGIILEDFCIFDLPLETLESQLSEIDVLSDPKYSEKREIIVQEIIEKKSSRDLMRNILGYGDICESSLDEKGSVKEGLSEISDSLVDVGMSREELENKSDCKVLTGVIENEELANKSELLQSENKDESNEIKEAVNIDMLVNSDNKNEKIEIIKCENNENELVNKSDTKNENIEITKCEDNEIELVNKSDKKNYKIEITKCENNENEVVNKSDNKNERNEAKEAENVDQLVNKTERIVITNDQNKENEFENESNCKELVDKKEDIKLLTNDNITEKREIKSENNDNELVSNKKEDTNKLLKSDNKNEKVEIRKSDDIKLSEMIEDNKIGIIKNGEKMSENEKENKEKIIDYINQKTDTSKYEDHENLSISGIDRKIREGRKSEFNVNKTDVVIEREQKKEIKECEFKSQETQKEKKNTAELDGVDEDRSDYELSEQEKEEIRKKKLLKIIEKEYNKKFLESSKLLPKKKKKKKKRRRNVIKSSNVVDFYRNRVSSNETFGKLSRKISIFERNYSKKDLIKARSKVLQLVLNDYTKGDSDLTENGKKLKEIILQVDPYLIDKYIFHYSMDKLCYRLQAFKRIISEKIDYSRFFTSFFHIFSVFHRKKKICYTRVENKLLIKKHQYLLQKIGNELGSWKRSYNLDMEDEEKILYKVCHNRLEVFEIIVNASKKIDKWKETCDSSLWNLCWTWSRPKIDRKKLLVWQKINHFENANELCRKNKLYKNIKKFSVVRGKKQEFFENLIPETFVLPGEYIKFLEAFTKYQSFGNNIWIMKPFSLSRGRGIKLINDISSIKGNSNVLVQKYVENPLLINGYKFDLRLYVLVTCFSPLEAFLYKEGFCRFSTQKFNTHSQFLSNKFIHLTNTSIQQHSPIGCKKIVLEKLKILLTDMNVNYDEIWNKIIELILKTLECVNLSDLSNSTEVDINSFELFGFDVLIDSNLKPWLIEINSSPSLECNLENDIVKKNLIFDTLNLINPLYFDKFILSSIIERRLDSNYRNLTEEEEFDQLNDDLKSIFHGRIPRLIGETPEKMGNYQLISGTSLHKKVLKYKYL